MKIEDCDASDPNQTKGLFNEKNSQMIEEKD